MTKRPARIYQELQQQVPFDSVGEEALVSLLKTVDVLRSRLDPVMESGGITGQQYNVLRILRGAGPDGINTLAIADRMIERAPGITRMIDRLERKGLVSRSRQDADRRCVTCRITNRGLELLEELEEPLARAHAEALQGITEKEVRRLIELLDAIREPL